MTRHIPRLCLDQDILIGNEYQLDVTQSHHLGRVMRVKPGDPVILFTATADNTFEYHAEVCTVNKNNIMVRVDQQLEPKRESSVRVTLVQAACRSSRMDFCLQKSVELGVMAIQPVLTHHGQIRFQKNRLTKKLLHWRGVVRSAAEQSGRTCVPQVHDVIPLKDWVESRREGLNIMLDPNSKTPLRDLTPPSNISILVGPEGGLSEDEIDMCTAGGIRAVSLGPRILRTETAGLAAISAIQTLWGDLG